MSWIQLALLSFLFMGLGNFLAKLATEAGQSALAILTLIFITDVFIAGALLFFKRPEFVSSAPALGWSVASGILLGLGLYFMIAAMGLPGAKTGLVTALMNANFVLVTVLSYVLLQETLTLKQILGLLAILGGMILMI